MNLKMFNFKAKLTTAEQPIPADQRFAVEKNELNIASIVYITIFYGTLIKID